MDNYVRKHRDKKSADEWLAIGTEIKLLQDKIRQLTNEIGLQKLLTKKGYWATVGKMDAAITSLKSYLEEAYGKDCPEVWKDGSNDETVGIMYGKLTSKQRDLVENKDNFT